jgi:hypothetical protein
MPIRFLDTSLPIRYFTRDDPEKADRIHGSIPKERYDFDLARAEVMEATEL